MTHQLWDFELNKFRTNEAAVIAMKWLMVAERAVRLAAGKVIMLNIPQDRGYGKSYFNNILAQKDPDSDEGLAAEQRESMVLGHAVETRLRPDDLATIYKELHGTDVHCWNHTRARVIDNSPKKGDFLVERAGPRPPMFPCEFSSKALREAGEATRPDIRVALGDGTEALFDFTTPREAGHIEKKGGGTWLRDDHVAFIAEIFTLNWDRRDPQMAAMLHHLDPTANPDPKDPAFASMLR
jgi:hypothetical protein